MEAGPALPLGQDGSGSFVIPVVAIMTALAVLALAGACALANLTDAWRHAVAGRATVYVAAVADDPADPDRRAERLQERASRALALLQASPVVRAARILPRADTEALLQPWVGPALLPALPVPVVIDLGLMPGAGGEIAALRAQLAALPGTRLDDRGAWLAPLRRLAASLTGVGLGVLATVGMAGVLVLVFSVRESLARHWDAVELLHLLGAPDGYIARQFERAVLALTWRGAVLGWVVGGTVLGLLTQLGAGPDQGLLRDLKLTILDWMLTLLLPVLACATAVAAGRITVLAALRRLP